MKKQSNEHSAIITEKIKTFRKSLRKIEHANLLTTPKKRRRESFLEVKTKIHEILWNSIHHRGHRYDVRAADREAIQMEQSLIESLHDTSINTTNYRKSLT
ncbi:hypothetical protein DINM_002933 [Dirofilaria immitis]|nr:hypothetical protein [Dirofilaria immitis]